MGASVPPTRTTARASSTTCLNLAAESKSTYLSRPPSPPDAEDSPGPGRSMSTRPSASAAAKDAMNAAIACTDPTLGCLDAPSSVAARATTVVAFSSTAASPRPSASQFHRSTSASSGSGSPAAFRAGGGGGDVFAVPGDFMRHLRFAEVPREREHVDVIRAAREEKIVERSNLTERRRDRGWRVAGEVSTCVAARQRAFERGGERDERAQVSEVPGRESRSETIDVRRHHRTNRANLSPGERRAVCAVHSLHQVMRLVEHHHRALKAYAERFARLPLQHGGVRREDQIRPRKRAASGVIRTRAVAHARGGEVFDVHRRRERRLGEILHRAASAAKERTSGGRVFGRRSVRRSVRIVSFLGAFSAPFSLSEFQAPFVESRGGGSDGERGGVDAQLSPPRDGDGADGALRAAESRAVQLADDLRELRVRPAAEDDLLRRRRLVLRVRIARATRAETTRETRTRLRTRRVRFGIGIVLAQKRIVRERTRPAARPFPDALAVARPFVREKLSLLQRAVSRRAARERGGVRRRRRRLAGRRADGPSTFGFRDGNESRSAAAEVFGEERAVGVRGEFARLRATLRATFRALGVVATAFTAFVLAEPVGLVVGGARPRPGGLSRVAAALQRGAMILRRGRGMGGGG